MSSQTIDHPIEQIVNTATTSVEVQSDTGIVLPSQVQSNLMVTPTIPLQPTTPYIPRNPIRTPFHHKMQNPATHTNSIVGKISIGRQPLSSGQIPTGGKPSLHIPVMIGGKPPFIGQTPVVTQPIVGGQPSSQETPQNLGDHPKEVRFINHTREGHQTPTRKEEY
jgi:hypothetical protein